MTREPVLYSEVFSLRQSVQKYAFVLLKVAASSDSKALQFRFKICGSKN
jgi:hypothetical protein